jgi:drug/metabolite transporter (DMT)-like permease
LDNHKKEGEDLRGAIPIIVCCLLTVCGQVLLKVGLMKNGGFMLTKFNLAQNVVNLLLSPIIILGIFVYVIATVIFMYLLNNYELTQFYPWTAMTYVFAFIAGVMIFKESIEVNKIIGTIVIIFGILIISRS